MVTEPVTAAEFGEMLVMLGVASTVKAKPLLGTPPTVTATFPLVAPDGTFTVIEVSLQLVMSLTSAGVPLKVTELPFCAAPKLVPVIVTGAVTPAELGDTLLIVAVGSTVKANPLLGVPPTVTTTFPLDAPVGTFTVIEVSLQLVTSRAAACVPLKLTVLLF
jgi:hypothetical protein